MLHVQSIVESLVHTWNSTQYFGVLEYGIDWRQGNQPDPLLEGLDVCMRAHIDEMDEQVEDRLQHYECFYPILVHLIVDDLGLHIDDVTEPVKDSEDHSPPNKELTEKSHFLRSVI